MKNIETMTRLGISKDFVWDVANTYGRIKMRTVTPTIRMLEEWISTLQEKLSSFEESEIESETILQQLKVYLDGFKAIHKKFTQNLR